IPTMKWGNEWGSHAAHHQQARRYLCEVLGAEAGPALRWRWPLSQRHPDGLALVAVHVGEAGSPTRDGARQLSGGVARKGTLDRRPASRDRSGGPRSDRGAWPEYPVDLRRMRQAVPRLHGASMAQ